MELINGETKDVDVYKKFICEKCEFICKRKWDFNMHLKTQKHIKTVKIPKMELKPVKTVDIINLDENCKNICNCGKTYKTQSGLWKHKQKCISQNQGNNILETNNNENILLEIVKSNQEFKQQMLDICKNLQPTITNNTINQHKTFNLNVFLNETCKNAMNLSDFIESIPIDVKDMENLGKVGFVECMSNIIIQNLRKLKVEDRPFHCTDLKREKVMIKENGEWFKQENGNSNLKDIINGIVRKKLKLLPDYQAKHPDCNNPLTNSFDDFNKMTFELMGGGFHDESIKNQEKIIRRIMKEIVIDKECY